MSHEPSGALERCTSVNSSHSTKEDDSPQARSRVSISLSLTQEGHQPIRILEARRKRNASLVILIVIRFAIYLAVAAGIALQNVLSMHRGPEEVLVGPKENSWIFLERGNGVWDVALTQRGARLRHHQMIHSRPRSTLAAEVLDNVRSCK